MRLQKVLAQMGVASRRKADEMIQEGRVRVNGEVAVPGVKADPEHDHIKLDGKLLTRSAEHKVYILMNKPVNVLTTLSDEEDTRACLHPYLKRVRERVYPVGRLDFDSEGLLLLTNDGDLAHSVLHPSKKMPKVYKVKVKGLLSEKEIAKFERGMKLDDGWTAPAEIKTIEKLKENSWVEIVLKEGKKRQIRRMLGHLGHPVSRLIRTKIGPLRLADLAPGELHRLEPAEVEDLKIEAGLLPRPKKK